MFIPTLINGKLQLGDLMKLKKVDNNIDYNLLGFRIGERRRELGIKQSELAKMLNVSIKYISNIETGKKHPSLDLLAKITIALDTTFDYFMNGYIRYNPSDNIYDGLKNCTEDDIQLILHMVRYCSNKKH